jgi:xylitol oxidase
MGTLTNWAGNLTYRAHDLVHPVSVRDVQEAVAGADQVRALGTRHCFNDIADTSGTLIALDAIPADVQIDTANRLVSVSAGTTYGALATELQRQGWALANLASLPHISLAGAIATGTHGSGDRNVSLAAAVRALDIVGPDGTMRTRRLGDPDFAGSVVALGALGVVTRFELAVEPSYSVRQDVFTNVGWDAVGENFDALTSAGYSVSLFTRYDDLAIRQMWVKSRIGDERLSGVLATVADGTLHMLDGAPTEAVTEQGGVPGPWLERLPHFRMEFTPSRGEELQSEYLVPRRHAHEAIAALRALADSFATLLQIAEIRTVAADDLWLSSAYQEDVVGLHFTWVRDLPAVLAVLGPVEAALLPLQARPHWGKVFRAEADELARLYPRFDDFRALRDRVDPDHKFGNPFLNRSIG